MLIVSAPFGNYLTFPHALRTLGSFTAARRGGVLHRLVRVAKTLRYHPKHRAWSNALGLPNPGIASVTRIPPHSILSLCGFNWPEWMALLDAAVVLKTPIVELNLSCPNAVVGEDLPKGRVATFPGILIAKLGPINPLPLGERLYALGIRAFHLCNTLPVTGRGGVSGAPLKAYSLRAVEAFRKTFGDTVTIIGGGGVLDESDAREYLDAGADHVAIASGLLNPLRHATYRRLARTLALLHPTQIDPQPPLPFFQGSRGMGVKGL